MEFSASEGLKRADRNDAAVRSESYVGAGPGTVATDPAALALEHKINFLVVRVVITDVNLVAELDGYVGGGDVRGSRSIDPPEGEWDAVFQPLPA